MQREIDLQTVDRALVLGRTALDTERASMHAGYRLTGAGPLIDYLEIVTPFRRIVLASQARMAAGQRSLAQREALDMLASASDLIDVYVEMTFHPLNTFVGVPDYGVLLATAAGTRVEPRTLSRLPRTGLRVEALPPALPSLSDGRGATDGVPLSGGTLVARFDLASIDAAGRYEVQVLDGNNELGRIAVDLGQLR